MKNFIIFLFLSFSFLSFAQAELKVGFVKVDTILKDAPQSAESNKRLEKEFKSRSEKLKKDIQALNDGEKKFRTDSITMSDDVQNQTQKKLQEKRIEIQRTERELREDIDLRRREEVTKLQNQVTIVIEKIATSEKFDLILYTGVAYASDSVDITSKVIKELGALK